MEKVKNDYFIHYLSKYFGPLSWYKFNFSNAVVQLVLIKTALVKEI